MHRVLASIVVVVLCTAASPLFAQTGRVADGLVGTWILVGAERELASEEPTPVRGARGMLVIDAAGNVFEFFNTPAVGDTDGSARLDEFGGFWGRYAIDGAQLRFESAAGVSPNVRGRSFTRNFELDGDRLVLTASDEPQAQGDLRGIWQRMPVVENLSPAYREVVGFWQHVVERRVDTRSGEVRSENRRDPSVIVYTPAGFVGVHFPSQGREAFAGEEPTASEAQGALRGYIGYFGTLGVYPGEVSHNLLSGVSPSTGSILRRYAEITDDELVVTLQSSGMNVSAEPPAVVTEVVLRRLSDADDMLPAPR